MDSNYLSCPPYTYQIDYHPLHPCLVIFHDVTDGARQTLYDLKEAVATGNPEAIKRLAGDLVLKNNGATIGMQQVAREIFPEIPDQEFAGIVGVGVLTFLSTDDPLLTVIAVAQQFAAQYQMQRAPQEPPGGEDVNRERSKKTYSVECLQFTRWDKPGGTTELWAGFHSDPVFVSDSGEKFTWPVVDIAKDDLVHLKASTRRRAPR